MRLPVIGRFWPRAPPHKHEARQMPGFVPECARTLAYKAASAALNVALGRIAFDSLLMSTW